MKYHTRKPDICLILSSTSLATKQPGRKYDSRFVFLASAVVFGVTSLCLAVGLLGVTLCSHYDLGLCQFGSHSSKPGSGSVSLPDVIKDSAATVQCGVAGKPF